MSILDAIHCVENGEPDEALRIASRILNDSPNEVDALCVSAQAFMQAERYGLAYNLYKRAVELQPRIPGIWNNLGLICLKMLNPVEARSYLHRSLKLDTKSWAAMNNLALAEVNDGKPQAALELCKKSLSIDHNQWDVHETMGYANLMLGNWTEGWDGYEYMVGNEKHRTFEPRREDADYWRGERGIPLHVRGEQGIGDEISFASMINDASEHNEVILECDKRLEGLFKRSFPKINVYGSRFEKNPSWVAQHAFDDWCLSGSLGWHYRTKTEDFDGEPYLKADPERKLQWKVLLDSLGTKPKVGIAWTGGLKDTHSQRRSVALEQLLPILKQDCTFVSLQYKPPTELAAFEQKHGIKIHHWARATETSDYDDTAALVDELDLVISVTTAVVDLCGALGKPCWVLVPNKPHWRYGMSGDKKVWYNSVKLFRQGKDWTGIIKTVGDELAQYIKAA
jgi:hypothetical protein